MFSLLLEHCQLIKEVIFQSLTGNAYFSLPIDVWIEWTMNKGSKLQVEQKGY